ncbi:C40 family peptidase [Nocardia sp. NPDC005978]|uniref:C40 family peptidase n=1 Tax=Nocardia sp. NPDC005978 TaxID=3156725 RepID=UPI0033A0A00A
MSAELDVAGLARPITGLMESLGSGDVAAAVAELRAGSGVVEEMVGAGRGGVDEMYAAWRGEGGDAALGTALRVQTCAATVADRGVELAAVLERAGSAVAAGQRELAAILRSFLDSADSAGRTGLTPAGIAIVVESALDHSGRALHVAERVRTELADETAAMRELIAPPPTPAPVAAGSPDASVADAAAAGQPGTPEAPAADTVAAAVGNSGGQLGQTLLATGGQALESGAGLAGGLTTVPASVGDALPADRSATGGTHAAGTGVLLTLPDGSTVEAPNQRAADAVRNALSELGTPYVWGGTTPGAGLDCSGLTQWAYAEAGVPLPRLAQEQGQGHAQIGPGDLMPGDLAVWDGHVAMVIGNGQLVEAGDPVQIGPIRTENSGMTFFGFYRPTA